MVEPWAAKKLPKQRKSEAGAEGKAWLSFVYKYPPLLSSFIISKPLFLRERSQASCLAAFESSLGEEGLLMTVAVKQTPFHHFEKYLRTAVDKFNNDAYDERPAQSNVGNAVESEKAADGPVDEPYVHHLVRRSSSSMSLKSLQICTERLGSETGSDELSDHEFDCVEMEGDEESKKYEYVEEKVTLVEEIEDGLFVRRRAKEMTEVNYHCSSVRLRSLPRSFPPPLPSISRRDGPCLHMRPHRRDGRLVVEAVAVPSRNYLHAQREGGRLVLCFVDASVDGARSSDQIGENRAVEFAEFELEKEVEPEKEEEEEDEDEEEEDDEEEEEEEEVEVVDRGTMVEVKVSTQPQQQSSSSTKKVLRSSLVINKFVSGTPDEEANNTAADLIQPQSSPKRPTTATAAAAVVAASTLSARNELMRDGARPVPGNAQMDNTLLFTSKRGNRDAILRSMRRCSQLRRPLFFWEPCCIATTS
ncbi:hypothetical protein ZIOFF_008304 [Zingiber officinale]|uniref:FAF domain-containing protein n=1 Tax=Zingiber officinale TaxID=94328 RepID=A0A8J5M6J6_ZINOF|nr:hypothetical protein ZIOFF_008304 [Zingiber officinale]